MLLGRFCPEERGRSDHGGTITMISQRLVAWHFPASFALESGPPLINLCSAWIQG